MYALMYWPRGNLIAEFETREDAEAALTRLAEAGREDAGIVELDADGVPSDSSSLSISRP